MSETERFRVPADDEADPERVGQQEELVGGLRLVLLGVGPGATGSESGRWSRSPNLFYRCSRCGYYMAAVDDKYEGCYCTAMTREPARFGSWFGDESIEVYLAPPA